MTNKSKIDTEMANSMMEKNNQGLNGENSEWIEGRKKKNRDKTNGELDLLDEIQQRSFKCGLIITSSEGKNKVSCVKSQEELRKEKKTVTDHCKTYGCCNSEDNLLIYRFPPPP